MMLSGCRSFTVPLSLSLRTRPSIRRRKGRLRQSSGDCQILLILTLFSQTSGPSFAIEQPSTRPPTFRSDFEAIDIALEEKDANAARKGFKSLFGDLDKCAGILESGLAQHDWGVFLLQKVPRTTLQRRYEAAVFEAIGVDPKLPELADVRGPPQ